MKRISFATAVGVVAVLAAGPLLAETPPPAEASQPAPAAQPIPAPSPTPEPPKLEVTFGGFYEFNGYSQNNFFLGKHASGGVTDRDDYMIQLFRLTPTIAYGTAVRAVLTIDLAQKIFGLDNEQRDNDRAGFTNLFNRKDTNFLVHLDNAYVELSPAQFRGWSLRVGRMRNVLGNQLVLDQDGDGIQISRFLSEDKVKLTLDWTKQFEGADSLTDDSFVGGVNGKDTDLFYADVAFKAGQFTLNPYFAYYDDRGWEDGTTYMPQGIQYFRARFTPNLTTASVFGFGWEGKIGRATFKGEGAYLTGKDKLQNANSEANQLLDVNDGDLKGYTLYADVKAPVGKATLGALFGLGSGDDDPMSGDGNVTKIRTQGFFYVNEVWEDSIMPDEQGITPQGLGSPGSRGYREFENTTLGQLNCSVPFGKEWNLFLSATLLHATEALRPWSDVNGNGAIDPGEFGTASSKDLGEELDFKLDWKLLPSLTWSFRGGILFAGDATGYLINGTDRFGDNPWELRTTIRFNFAGLKLR